MVVVVGGSSEAGGGEEASDELMLLHCSSSVHTRHPALLKPFAPPLAHARRHVCCGHLIDWLACKNLCS